LVENTAITAAQGTPLTYVQVQGRAQPTGEGSRGFRLYLGTIPNYSDDIKNGVLISGTSKGSPADKAGVQTGDLIVELGGIKIKTLSDYAYCLQALKANEPTKMRVVRAGREVELAITPALK
jgi:S1-C subfamily serine protease